MTDVIIACDRCQRPVVPVSWGGDISGASIIGTIRTEAGKPALRHYQGGRHGSRQQSWAGQARYVDTSQPGAEAAGKGRMLLRCSCGKSRGRPPIQRVVTQAALDAAIARAVAEGDTRVWLSTIRE